MIPRLLYLLTPLNNPLVDNAGKRSPIVHLTASIAAFEKLMSVIADLPSLYAFDENKPVLVFTDASQLAIGAIITQEHLIQGQKLLVPVAMVSLRLSATQQRYSTLERELLTIVYVLQKYKQFMSREVQFYTDHQAITTIGSAKLEPANRIKRFIDIIQSFNPSIYFIPGQFNFIADFLSRYNLDKIPHEVNEEAILNQTLSIYLPTLRTTEPIPLAPIQPVQRHHIHIDNLTDNQLQQIHDQLCGSYENNNSNELLPTDQFVILQDQFHVVLSSTQVVPVVTADTLANTATKVHEHHHASIRVTDYLVSKIQWHPNHKLLCTNVIRNCLVCQLSSTFETAHRELYPLTPTKTFSRWGLDFIGPLPMSDNLSCCLNAIEYVSGLIYSWPCSSPNSDVVILMLNLIRQVHSTPVEVITDNGSAFTSNATQSFCATAGISIKYASVYHPMSNGRMELGNKLLKKILKSMTDAYYTKWPQVLANAVMVYNSTPTTFNKTPYYLLIGISTDMSEFTTYLANEFEWKEGQLSQSSLLQDLHNDVQVRLAELDGVNKNVEKHNDLRVRRMAYINLMRQPFQKPASFIKGDWDLLRRRVKRKKSEYNYMGPYQIAKVLDKHAYVICDTNGNMINGTIHHDDLKYCYSFNDNSISRP